jgi:hypothetical protein
MRSMVRCITPVDLGKREEVSSKTLPLTLLKILITPRNVLKRWMYWNLPAPFGIAGVRREDMIDFDQSQPQLWRVPRDEPRHRFRKLRA